MTTVNRYVISAWPMNSFEAMALLLSYRTTGKTFVFFNDLEGKTRMVGVREAFLNEEEARKKMYPIFEGRLKRIYVNPHTPEPLLKSLWLGLKDENGNLVKRGVKQSVAHHLRNVSNNRWKRFCEKFMVTDKCKLVRRPDEEDPFEGIENQVPSIEEEIKLREEMISEEEENEEANKEEKSIVSKGKKVAVHYLRRRFLSKGKKGSEEKHEKDLRNEYLRNLRGYYVVWFNGLIHEYKFVKENELDTFLSASGLYKEAKGVYRPLQEGEYRKWKYTKDGSNKEKVLKFIIDVDQNH